MVVHDIDGHDGSDRRKHFSQHQVIGERADSVYKHHFVLVRVPVVAWHVHPAVRVSVVTASPHAPRVEAVGLHKIFK